jgi:hypothetical protein
MPMSNINEEDVLLDPSIPSTLESCLINLAQMKAQMAEEHLERVIS